MCGLSYWAAWDGMQEPKSTESRGFDDCVRLSVVGVGVAV